MTKDKFYEQCGLQFQNIWDIHRTYEARSFDTTWIKAMANDFRLVASNLDELCEVYDMENRGVK